MMDKNNDFDDFVYEYNNILSNQVKFFDSNGSYFAEYKIQEVSRILEIKPGKILDYGCGIGRSFEFFKRFFPEAELYGMDSSGESLNYSRKNYPYVYILDTEKILEHKHSFDLVFVSNVFHHINHKDHSSEINLIYNLLKSNGELIVFEQNQYNPVTKYLIKKCPFDKNANLIKKNIMTKIIEESGFCVKKASYSLFFPSKLRFLRQVEKYLGKIPLGGQYYVYAKKKSK